MQKKSSNQSSIKIKFLFILILSNAVMFILSSNNQEYLPKKQANYIKKDYIKIKINAELMTEFIPYGPVKLIDSKRNIIIKYVFLLNKITGESHPTLLNESDNTHHAQYLVYIHKKHSQQIFNYKSLKIYPHEFQVSKRTKRQRTNDEIIF